MFAVENRPFYFILALVFICVTLGFQEGDSQTLPAPFRKESFSYSLVQSVGGYGGSPPFTIGPISNTPGNTLVLVINFSILTPQTANVTVTDTSGNNWIGTAPLYLAGGPLATQVWYAPYIATSAANTITVNYPNSGYSYTLLMEIFGPGRQNILDTISFVTSSSAGATISTGNITPTRDSVVIANFALPANTSSLVTLSGAVGYASATDGDSITSEFHASGVRAGVAENISVSQTDATNSNWGAITLALRSKSGSAAMAVAATKLAITSASLNTGTWTCSPVTIEAEDASGTQRALQSNVSLALSGSGLYFFSDSNCQSQITTLYLWAGQKTVTLYVQQGTAGVHTLTATPNSGFNVLTQSETASLSNFTWIGGTSSNWNTASNWSNSAVPGSSDTAYFDGNCTTNCSATLPTAAVTVSQLNLMAAYTGTLGMGASGASLTATTGITIIGGHLSGPAGSALTVGDVYIGSGASAALSGPATVTGNFSGNSTYSNGNTTTFTGTGVTIDYNDNSFSSGNVTFNHSGGTFYVKNLSFYFFSPSIATLTAGTVTNPNNGTGTLYAYNFSIGSSGAVTLSNQSTLTVRNNLSISAGGSMNLDGNSAFYRNSLPISGTAITNAGTITCTGGNALIYLQDGGIINTGTFNTPSCTTQILFQNSGGTISGDNTFGNLFLELGGGGAKTATFSAGRTQTITSSFGTDSIFSSKLSFRSSVAGQQWKLSIPGATTLGGYLDVKDSNNVTGFSLHSGANFTNSGNNTNWTFP